ncbi:MAG: hypothetical protein AAF614_16745 [Chloroflexota bacterium]
MKFRFDSPAAIFVLVGIPFLIAGAVVGLFVPRAFSNQRAEVAELTPLTLDELRETAVGERVLIEGTISPDTAEQAVGLVAYNLYRSGENSDGEDTLELADSVTPPLTLQVPNGLVRIGNDSYDIRAIAQTANEDNLHYSGFGRRDALFVVGTLTAVDEIPLLNAEFVSAGTQADFVAEQNLFIGGWWLFACVFAVIGLGLLGTAVFLALRQ